MSNFNLFLKKYLKKILNNINKESIFKFKKYFQYHNFLGLKKNFNKNNKIQNLFRKRKKKKKR